MGIFQNHLMGAAAAAASAGSDFYEHQVGNSVRMQMGAGSRLRRTPSGAGNRQTWAISMWVKRAKVGDEQFLYEAGASGDQDGRLRLVFTDGDALMVGTGNANLATSTELFRDPAAFYHIHWKNTGGTNTVHVNGTQVISVSCSGDTAVNNTVAQGIGCRGGSGDDTTSSLEGYIAEFLLFDGTAYSYTDVTDEKNGVLVPADPSGLTFGTNGAWLKFESSGDLGNDSSGNNNDWTESNLAAHDQMLDSPTFGSSSSGNFAVMSPLFKSITDGSATLSENNLKFSRSSAGNYMTTATMSPYKGKYYFEVYWAADSGVNNTVWGLIKATHPNLADGNGSVEGSDGAKSLKVNSNNAYLENNGTNTSITMNSTTPDTGWILGFAIDYDNGKVFFGQDGGSSSRTMNWSNSSTGTGVPADGTNPALTFTAGDHYIIGASISSIGATTSIFNFGQDSSFAGAVTGQNNEDGNGYGDFYYTPPTGFVALCSGNGATEEKIDPKETDDDYPRKLFNPILYSGNDTTNNITGLGFQPDLMLFKIRNTASSGMWVDSSRGRTKAFYSIANNAEVTIANITAIGTDGFSLDGTSDYKANFNGNGNTYVTWAWRVNGGTTSSDASGDITSVGQADPSGCVSIFTYTGSGTQNQTVAHHLSQAPDLMIFKRRNSTNNFMVTAGTSYMNTRYMYMDTTAAAQSGLYNSGRTFSANAGASLLTLEGAGEMNGSSDTYVAYAFSNCEGYIQIGEYEGSGNADGAVIYTGFRPSLIITKALDSTSDWQVFDDKREGYNVDNDELFINIHDAESTTDMIDILSNGFKMRIATDPNVAETYLYMAFAENPFQYATAR